jgi:hypothetical protein
MSMTESTAAGQAISGFERTYLEKLLLAANVILAESTELDLVAASLTGELDLFKDRLERELLLPAAAASAFPGVVPPTTPFAPEGGDRP